MHGSSASPSTSDADSPPPPPPLSRTSSSFASHRHRRRSSSTSATGPVTLYQRPFYRGAHGGSDTASGPTFPSASSASPPLRITTRRLQVFSYVLAELSSAATLLPDYTRAILNLSRKLIGAWQAVTAAAIARTRYEHALIWAAYHRQQQQQQQQHDRHMHSVNATSATFHEGGAPAAASTRAGKRRGARRRSPPSTSRSTSAAAVLFNAAAAAASTHKRPRLGGQEGRKSASGKRTPSPSTVARSRPAKRTSRPEQRGRGHRAGHGLTPPLSLPLSGATERRARQLALRQRDQLLLSTLQQLWLDAQEKEDKAGQHVEYLRGVILNVLFQQYLAVTVEQSFYDLVLYRWLTPVLVSVRDCAVRDAEGQKGARRWSRIETTGSVPGEEAAASANNNNNNESPSPHSDERQQQHSFFNKDVDPLQPLEGELERGGGGGVRRARRRQASMQVSRDVQLLRQVLQRAQITMGGAAVGQRRRRRGEKHAGSVPTAPAATGSGKVASPATSSSSSCGTQSSLKRQRSPSLSPSAPRSRSRITREEKMPPSSVPAHEDENTNTVSDADDATAQRSSTPQPAAETADRARSAAHTALPHGGAPEPPPLSPDGLVAVPLPLHLFLQACASFDPTHCAFSLVSRCVVLARNVRGGEEEDRVGLGSAASSPSKRPAPFTEAPTRTETNASYGDCAAADAGLMSAEEDAQGTFSGLFYVVIGRRAVGACTHTALCFGNHKFIFVRCHDTESLIREVMLDDEDDVDAAREEGKSEWWAERRGRTPPTTGCDDDVGGGDAASTSARTQEEEEVKPLSQQRAQRFSAFDREEAEIPRGEALITTAVGGSNESSALLSPIPPVSPTPSMQRPSIGITALTAQDARRLQLNASADSAALPVAEATESGVERGVPCEAHVHLKPAHPFHTSNDIVADCAMHDAPTATPPPQPHVPPLLRPLLSGTASTTSTLSSTSLPTSGVGAAAAARRWGHHMRQAARVGRQASPPPFVSADATDLQRNPGFMEALSMPALPAPPPRALRPAEENATALRGPESSGAAAGAVVADASESVHSPLHLTPLAFHTRVQSSATSRSRAPPPRLDLNALSPDRRRRMQEAERDNAVGTVDALNNTGSTFGGSVDQGFDEATVPAASSASATATPLHAARSATATEDGQWRSHSADTGDAESDAQPAYIVMHSVLCSCVRSGADDGGKMEESGFNSSSSSSNSRAAHDATADDSAPCLFSGTEPRASAFPSSLRATAGVEGKWQQHQQDSQQQGFDVSEGEIKMLDDFPLSSFEQQVLLPPSSGQERRQPYQRRAAPSPSPSQTRPAVASSLSALQSSSARAAAASHLFDIADPLHAAHVAQHHMKEQEANEEAESGEEGDASPLPFCTAGEQPRTSAYACGSPPLSPSFSPAPVEPSEGDMAFAAELYARMEFWCLRGQDRSAYLDPSWLRGKDVSHADVSDDAIPSEAEGEGHGKAGESKGPANAERSSCLSKEQQHQRRESTTHRSSTRENVNNRTTVSAADSMHSRDASPTDVPAQQPPTPLGGMVRLPLKLLDYTAGTIELADEAALAELQQQRRRHARKGAAARVRRAGRQSPKAARGIGESTMREKATGSEGSSSSGAEEDFDDERSERDYSAVEQEGDGDEAGSGQADFPALTPLMTVNAKGKELLFEALQEATEVVVCAVRESRAHAGYHDVLHQRCPTPLPTPQQQQQQQSSSPQLSPSTFAGGIASDAQGKYSAESGALTPVNSWALTAALAAAQGCTFPVPVGTLSHDDRCPFTFDRHQHLGTYGTVRWSQGSAAVENGAGDAKAAHASSSFSSAFTPSSSHEFHWPVLPAHDEKQWRCELLKSEFRLARSRALDALLVDSRHGRPIAAITLEPRSWTQVEKKTTSGSEEGGRESEDGDGSGGEKGSQAKASSPLFHLPTSAEEVVQRTVYVVTTFTHYITPLWRHLREEKAVLVDMDRTLVDNVVTVHTAAERQRHLLHLNRAVAAAEGQAGSVNPCLLWRPQRRRASAAKFAAPPFRVGRNDAMPLTLEELSGELPDSGVACDEESVPHSSMAAKCSRKERRTDARPFSTGAASGVHYTSSQSPAAAADAFLSSEGLLHAFLHRTAAQRSALGTLHYEECGAVTYAAGPLTARKTPTRPTSASPASSASSPSSTSHRLRADASGNSTPPKPTAADAGASSTSVNSSSERGGVYSDLVYVRPGVRQFLYCNAVRWNIPVVLVTKSTRRRTEAILRSVLDPHRVLFPDLRACVVTADEMVAATNSTLKEGEGSVEAAGAGSHTLTTAEPITHCRKSALRVVQTLLDAGALRSAKQAWRAPPWCDLLARLPRPRSVAVLDDAPQVWEERDWPATVNVAAYTLSRVDPLPYFAPQGFVAALVLSCLYGSRCLVCSAGELHGEESAVAGSATLRGEAGAEEEKTGSASPPSPFSDAVVRRPCERWPHCLCVCPPDHAAAMADAAGPMGGDDAAGFYVRDAAASVRAMLAELLWRSSSSSRGAELRRLRPLLLAGKEPVDAVTSSSPQFEGRWMQRRGNNDNSNLRRGDVVVRGRVSPIPGEEPLYPAPSSSGSVGLLRRTSKPHHTASPDSTPSSDTSSASTYSSSAASDEEVATVQRDSPSSVLDISMPATPTSFPALPSTWMHTGPLTEATTAATQGVVDVDAHTATEDLESGGASYRSVGGRYGGPCEDVEPVEAVNTNGADGDTTNSKSEVDYTRATATRGGMVRSASTNSDVEDVVPLEVQSARSSPPVASFDAHSWRASSGAKPSLRAAPPVVEDVTCDVAVTVAPAAASPRGAVEQTAELRRPERRRVDDPRDAVEDVVPL